MTLPKNLKKFETIRIQKAEFSDRQAIFDVKSKADLEAMRDKEPLFETENDVFLVKSNSVFRYVKPAMPKMVEAKSLFINPDSCNVKAELTEKDFLDFCRREHLYCFSTEDQYILPLGDLVLCAAKRVKEHGA